MQLSLLLERVLAEDTNRDAMLNQTVKNPDTNQDITVRTALGYDKNHPARKAAARIYAQYMQKQQTSQPAAKPVQPATPTTAPTAPAAPTTAAPARSNMPPARRSPAKKFSYQNKLRNQQQTRRPAGDDGYDAMRDTYASNFQDDNFRTNDKMSSGQKYKGAIKRFGR